MNTSSIAARYGGGDMAMRVLFSPWRFDDEDVSLSPKGSLSAQGETQIDEVHFVSRNPGATKRLVLFGDSFAERMVPFFAQHFGEVHRYVEGTLDGSSLRPSGRSSFCLKSPSAIWMDFWSRRWDWRGLAGCSLGSQAS